MPVGINEDGNGYFFPFKRKGQKYIQGTFKPKNWKKYKGDPTRIIYRSSLELKFMMFLDNNPSILEWSSEETIIPYLSPLDKQPHRYFVDFKVKMETKRGQETHLIEIKPLSQTKIPPKREKVTKAYLNEIKTFAVNEAKWKSAEEFAKRRGWKFTILTEKDL